MSDGAERDSGNGPDTRQRPNFVVILADDLGFSDIGCFGSEIATPNLDALAGSGLRFSQAYNCARCCPTRAALLTGLYPHQAGVGHMVGDYGIREYQGYLRDDCVTIAEALQGGGYRTMMAGKWHVGGGYQANRPETWRPGARRIIRCRYSAASTPTTACSAVAAATSIRPPWRATMS